MMKKRKRKTGDRVPNVLSESKVKPKMREKPRYQKPHPTVDSILKRRERY